MSGAGPHPRRVRRDKASCIGLAVQASIEPTLKGELYRDDPHRQAGGPSRQPHATIDDKRLRLSPKEFDILELLALPARRAINKSPAPSRAKVPALGRGI